MKSVELICRVCAKVKARNTKNLFSSSCSEFLNQMELITGIKFKNEVNLPQNICPQCIIELKQSHAFRSRCIKSQHYFASQHYQKSLKQTEIKSKRPRRKQKLQHRMSFNALVADGEVEEDVNINIEHEKPDTTTEPVKEEPICAEVQSVKDMDLCHLSDDDADEEKNHNTLEFEMLECESKLEEVDQQNDPNDDVLNANNEENNEFGNDNAAALMITKKMKAKSTVDKLKLEKCKKDNDIEKLHDFVCDQCGNYFRNRNHFRTHLNRHNGFKPYDCELCSDKFYTNSELRRHMRHHTGEKPFACRHCDRSFSDYSTRCKHERTHTNERPYSCIHCSKAFTTTYILKNHLLVHTGERRFHCALCNKAFQRQTHLIVHYRSLMHKQNEEKSQKPKEIETSSNSETKT